jgi:hypothetical protein
MTGQERIAVLMQWLGAQRRIEISADALAEVAP